MISVDKLMRNNSRFSTRCGWTITRGYSTCIVQTSSTLRLALCPTDSSSNRLVILFFAKPRIYRHIYRTYNANRSPGSWRMFILRNSSWMIQNMSLRMGGLKTPLQTPVSTTCRFHCWNDQRSFICVIHLEHSAERRQGLLRPGPICLSQLHGQCTVLLFLQEVRWSE